MKQVPAGAYSGMEIPMKWYSIELAHATVVSLGEHEDIDQADAAAHFKCAPAGEGYIVDDEVLRALAAAIQAQFSAPCAAAASPPVALTAALLH
jgi:hypothetical protein